MRVSILDANAKIPLIDLLGGFNGHFSGEIPSIEFVSKNRSDYFLSPHDWWDIKDNKEYLNYLLEHSRTKKVLLFNRSDFPGSMPSPNIIHLQNTIEVGGPIRRRVIVPYNIDISSSFTCQKYKNIPTISFLGYLPKITIGRVMRSIYPDLHLITKNSAMIRRVGVMKINREFESSKVQTNSFYGGARSQIPGDLIEHRNRYLLQIQSTDINFCPRGDANGSQRLYETLAMGRIPLVPDTKIYLPKVVEWRDLNVIIVSPLLLQLREKIINFWDRLNDSTYTKAQRANYEIYEKKLQYKNFIDKMFKSTTQEFESNYIY